MTIRLDHTIIPSRDGEAAARWFADLFGVTEPVPAKLREMADEVVPWNGREIADAIRRQARHEDTKRWDVIEFKLD